MKICMLTDAWAPVWGGGQTHIWEISRILREKYHCEVDVIVPNLAQNSGVIVLGPRFVFPNLFGRILFAFLVLGYCLTNDYDIYHSHCFSTSIFLPIVKILRGKKIAFTLHGRGVKGLESGASGLIVRIFNFLPLGRVMAYVVTYLYPYNVLFSAAFSSVDSKFKNRAVVTGNGVNACEFTKPLNHSRLIRLLWVGRDDPVKGLDYLVAAFNKIKGKYPRLRLIIVKDQPHAEVIKAFAQSDIFVLPSLSEGFPITILEAMAAKLPVIASRVGDVPEIVKDNETGYLVEPGNSDALINVLEKTLANKKLKQMGLSGYNLVHEKYTWDKVAQRIYEAYK